MVLILNLIRMYPCTNKHLNFKSLNKTILFSKNAILQKKKILQFFAANIFKIKFSIHTLIFITFIKQNLLHNALNRGWFEDPIEL